MHHTRSILAVLLLTTACASTPERYDYSGSTPTAPTYTPAGAGAPARGQPGAVDPDRKTLPRSPNRRTVEPRRDGQPQFIAADGDDARTVALMLSEPVSPAPEGIAPSAWGKCWRDFQRMAQQQARFRALTSPEAKCLRLLVLNHCGARMVEAAESGNEDFLSRYPPEPSTRTGGPRGERPAGTYSQSAFEDATTTRRHARMCGREHEFWTERVTALMRYMTQHGDDVLGWRNP